MTDSHVPKPHESTTDVYHLLKAPKSLIETIKSFKDKKIPSKIQETLLLQSYEKHHKKKLFGLRRATGITGTDKDGKTPLIHAVLSGDVDTVRWLCDNQAGRDPKHQDPNADHLDNAGKNALMYAISKGDLEMVKILAPLTNRHHISQQDKMVPLGYVLQEKNAAKEMYDLFTQNIRYEVDTSGILLALVRSQRSPKDLKELTKWVFAEVVKSIDERDLEKALKKAGKTLTWNSSMRGVFYVEAFLFDQYVQHDLESRDRLLSENLASETLGSKARYSHYEYLCLKILDLAFEQGKFDVIEHVVSTSIQSDYQIERPKKDGKWGWSGQKDKSGEEDKPDQNLIWSKLLDYAIDRAQQGLTAKLQSNSTKEFEKLYTFIKYFLQLASKEKNAVFLHNESWDEVKNHILSHTKKIIDIEMLRLLKPYFKKEELMMEPPKVTRAGDTLQTNNPHDSYKAFQRYQKKSQQKQQQHSSDDSSDSEGEHHTSGRKF